MSVADLRSRVSSSGNNVRPTLTRPKRTSGKIDTTTVEGLAKLGNTAGFQEDVAKIVDEKPKMGFLRRLGAGLGAFNPAEALLTGKEKGLVSGAIEYPKNILQGIGSAITGTDYQPKRRTFSDVATELGVENRIAKFGIGFLGDVLLDPSTYFGGAMAKGLTGALSKTANTSLKTIGKFAPETEEGLKIAGKGLQDALGRAFKFGYGSTKGAYDDVITQLTKTARAKMGLAASNLNRLGTNVLSKEQQLEVATRLLAGKRAEFVARQAGVADAGALGVKTALQGADETVTGVLKSQMERTAKFGEQLGLEDAYASYFPSLRKDKLAKMISETQGIRIGSQGYLKQFKDVLTNEQLNLDVADAFFTSEARQVTDRMNQTFLQGFVKKYGKPINAFKSADEASGAGYKLLKTKGQFGKDIGYINKYDHAIVTDAFRPEFQTIDMLAKATGFDALTSLFKRSVTGPFPPFHIRNYVSGHIQNYETLGIDALNPKNINLGQKIALIMAKGDDIPNATIRVAGESRSLKDVMKPFVERFSGDTFYNTDFKLALENGSELRSMGKVFSKESAKKMLGFQRGNIVPIFGQDGTLFRSARSVGQFIEHQQKATAYVTALGQGKSIPEAMKLAEVAGFDYRALTRFESQILRRIVPFYSFTRKNIELQLKTLGENPQRINQVMRFFGSFGEQMTPEERAILPDFIRESLGVKLQDTPDGLKQYVANFGTPIEAFTQLFEENPVLRAISMMNPILKVPVEIGIGKDSFRQRDLKDVYNANEYKAAPQFVKELLQIREVKKDVLKRQPNGDLKKIGERIEYQADPERLLIARSLFTSRGVSYLDQVFGGDLTGFAKFLKLTTGMKPTQVDIGAQEFFAEREKKRALEDLLLKTNTARKAERLYFPKK